ncbi:PIR protein [Plasmodium yoelii]|uniref:PIR protein n=3 Tax=Plasmodium yoelii TaxID=5861 RepID=A0AAF0B732_PLAYO|nr:PIR protein [Plasmodium yoelii]WBY60481.1 PIR protein [Plasmodium yoelii yoelii]CDU20332.1 YIR protein [Plasmodium yoelii]VTZ81090.1 PIR protein [Plasmodium yoelii]|eukprot:XP_022813784.1 PIR protein [Plasmodium yoelii]
MTLKVCTELKEVDGYLPDNFNFEKDHKPDNIYNYYCKVNYIKWKRDCINVGQVVSAVTMLLLNKLFALNKNLESENKNNEYITYVMLWLSNKMKLLTKGSYGSVADFFVTFIKDSRNYKIYLDKINKNKKIMYLEIDRMRILYGLLKDLCNAIIKYNNDSSISDSSISDFSTFVNNWEKQYKQLVEKKKKVFEDEHYCNVLMTLQNAYQKFKQNNKIQKKLPEITEVENINYCKELCSKATSSSKVIHVEFRDILPEEKDLEEDKDILRYMDVFKNGFKTYSLYFYIFFTNNVNDLYKKALPTLKDLYCKFINFADITIGDMNEQLKKAIATYAPANCISEEKGPGDKPPSSQEDPPGPPEPSDPSDTSDPSKPPISKVQISTSHSSPDLSENGGSEKNDYKTSQISEPSPVMKPKVPVFEVAVNGTTEIGENPFNVYKKMGISILILLIPIALVIMYKYLPFGWRKKSKKKKKMKRAINMFDKNETTEGVINPTDRKKPMQIIINLSTQNKQGKKFINSSTPKKQDKKFINSYTPKKQDKKLTNSSTQKKQDKKLTNSSTPKKQDKKLTNSSTQKKQTKNFINSYTQKKQDKKLTKLSTPKKQDKNVINFVYWEKYPLLNIYKLMKADPVPFIILFLLFIFYVYKRKGDSLE